MHHSPYRGGYDTLEQAIAKGDCERVEELLGSGVRLPKDAMMGVRTYDMAVLLMRRGADAVMAHGSSTPIAAAAARGDVDVVRALVEAGVPVDVPVNSPLISACHARKCEVVKYLLSVGAKATVVDHNGMTPAQIAMSKGDYTLMRALLEGGADARGVDMPYMREFEDSFVVLLLRKGARLRTGYGSILHTAAFLGHTLAARAIIEGHRINVNELDPSNRTPLHFAASPSMVDVLAWHGAAINARDINGITPFVAALQAGRLDVAQGLLRLGADMTAKSTDGRTALHLACTADVVNEYGAKIGVDARDAYGLTPLFLARDRATVKALKRLGADVNARHSRGETALHAFVRRAVDADAIRAAIEEGCMVNVRDDLGYEPLHVAAMTQNMEAARALIDANADLNARDLGGRTPLHAVIAAIGANGSKPLPQLPEAATKSLKEGEREPQPKTVGERAARCVAGFIRMGADANAPNAAGETPLLTAIKGMTLPVVEALLTGGADVNMAATGDERTPLVAAFAQRCKDIAEVLIASGAALVPQVEPHLVPEEWCEKLLLLMLEKDKEKVMGVTFSGRATLLHVALRAGYVRLCILLVENGADVNARDAAGLTPLHCARNRDQAKLLIDKGADVHARDNHGRTPLHSAAERGDAYVCATLINHDADLHATNNDDETPMSLAKQRGENSMVYDVLANAAGLRSGLRWARAGIVLRKNHA